MNYPHEFSRGPAAYWRDFRFAFEPEEVLFLRHGELRTVIPGGSPFAAGGHDSIADRPRLLPARTVDGLRLALRVRRAADHGHRSDPLSYFAFGEPVHVEAKLANVSGDERPVRDALDPSHGHTTYLIRKPNGMIVEHLPTMRRCSVARQVVLHPESRPAIYEDIDLTFGSGGFHFVEPGRYEIQSLMCHEGQSLVSAPLPIWVGYPARNQERHLATAFDERVGIYLALWGSESPHLQKAREILDSIADRRELARHPLLDWYRLCQGCLAVRGFKAIDADGVVRQVVSPDGDMRAVRQALGVTSRAYKRRRAIRLSHLVVSRLWGWLIEGAQPVGRNEVVQKRLDGAVADLEQFAAPGWAMANLMGKWGVGDLRPSRDRAARV
jgi:hypothetical protein